MNSEEKVVEILIDTLNQWGIPTEDMEDEINILASEIVIAIKNDD